MQKIPTIYLRDPEDRAHILLDINPECQWVFDGEGVATRKFDGTCMKKSRDGIWWARREVKKGKNPPADFVVVNTDPVTGKKQGWEPAHQSPFAKFLKEALTEFNHMLPGTYELIGPKINGNPEKVDRHVLQSHNAIDIVIPEKDHPLILIEKCRRLGWEGIVWHHHDGRMAKLKVKDLKEK